MISVCILTKNCQETLRDTLLSTTQFPEVLLLDNGSTDQTLSIAKTFPNVTIYELPFSGFGPLRNEAARRARYPWILALDSDEVLSLALQKEIQELSLSPQTIYHLPRHNYYRGRWIRGCGWHPEVRARLYHRDATCFSSDQVHEALLTKGHSTYTLSSPLLHTPYRAPEDFFRKQELYSTLFAEEHQGKQSSSFLKALLHGGYAFLRSYILKKGFLFGRDGFFISCYNAKTTFLKYIKLKKINKTVTK